MTEIILEQIHGFTGRTEYDRFVQFIESHVEAGNLIEVVIDKDYGRGQIYGGRWFRDSVKSAVWRLVPPDFPFRGLWEPVER